MEFSLEGREYIELNKLLKFISWTESGGEANQEITAGNVQLNNEVETRKRCKLKPGDSVTFNGNSITITL